MSELMMISVPGVTMTPEVLLRVVLVPRLSDPPSGDGTKLADYGMQNWPAVIADASFDVTLRTAAGVDLPATTVAVHTEARPEVWDAFFSSISVTPFIPPAPYDAPSVTPSSEHAGQVMGAYQATTAAVGDPTVVNTQLAGLSFQPPPPAPDPNAPVTHPDPPDFHRALALLREHPQVLRALGLIVDVSVDPALVASCGGAGAVSVGWPAAGAQFAAVTSPRTRFEVVDGRFVPAAAGLLRAGQVDLTTGPATQPDWTVQTVDIDTAVARLSAAQTAMQRTAARAGAGPGVAADPAATPVAMPALRSMGLQLTHRRRQEMFLARTAQARTRFTAAAAEDLTAEDVALGYRLDVRTSGGSWFSLMRRQATYQVGGVTIAGPSSEEGHVKAAAAVRGTDRQLYADEVVVRWDGSRLAVPVTPPPAPTTGAAPVAGAALQQSGSAPTYAFSWTFDPDPAEPAGAPELRFGHSYQLRLRVADIAGGGLGVDDIAGEAMAAPLQTYARHEPVLPPVVPAPTGLLTTGDAGRPGVHVNEDVLGPGGSLTRLVVRSDPAGDAPLSATYPDNAQRALLPPPTAFTLAEWEDKLSGADLATWQLARRALAAPRASARPRAGRQYTWLPDPAADGVSLTVLPAAERWADVGPRSRAWNPADWPDHPGRNVVVQAGAQGSSLAADWSSDTEAHISLPPAVRATVEIASTIDSVYFGRFAASAWAPVGSTAQQAVITGRHPVVTPAHRLEVVHAVRRPLTAPNATLTATRSAGDTTAELADANAPLLGVDQDSTLQLDIVARWDEPQDLPATDGQAGSGFAAPQPITRALGTLPVDLDATRIGPIRHAFGDTKHRAVSYEIAARSRFRDFFDPADPEAAFVRATPLEPVDVPSTARPTPLTIIGVTPAFATDRTTPGVLRRSGGTMRVELAGPWFTTGADEQLGLVVSPAVGLPPSAWEPGVSGTPADASGPLAHLVTTAYRDPVQATAGPKQPDSSSLTGTAGSPLVVSDLESSKPICVVPFDVFRRGDRLFADVGLGALADLRSDSPMVRLSLVRFQRHSLGGLTTSPIVRTDLINVLPARVLRAQTAGADITVTLTGTGPDNVVEAELQAISRDATSDLTALPVSGGVIPSPADESPGWSVVSTATGRLNAPLPPIRLRDTGQSYRLVVREVAQLTQSRDATSPDPLIAGLAGRVLFAGVLPL